MFPETEESWLDEDNVVSDIDDCKWIGHYDLGDVKMALCDLDECNSAGRVDQTSTDLCS
jgi:hypothetical protein